MDAWRVGVIGCGRIAQIMHLPYLAELPQFDLVAISDIDPGVLDGVGSHYPNVARVHNSRDLIDRDDIQVVVVLTPDHAEIVEQVARAGKHMFVEKPLCFTREEAERVRRAVNAAGVRLVVGYMRPFDPTYQRLVRMLPELGPVRFVRGRDFLGLRSFPTGVYSLVETKSEGGVKPPDRGALVAHLSEQFSGDVRRAQLYFDVLMLGVHDFSVLRPILGSPSGVVTTTLLGPRHLTTTLRYPNGVRASLELGVWPSHPWVDTTLEVITDHSTTTMSFPNPWVRHLPSTLVHRADVDDDVVDHVAPLSYRSMYREEWIDFDTVLRGEREPLAGLDEGIEDVYLAAEIIEAISTDALKLVIA